VPATAHRRGDEQDGSGAAAAATSGNGSGGATSSTMSLLASLVKFFKQSGGVIGENIETALNAISNNEEKGNIQVALLRRLKY
jgi:hypothetical protein